MASDATQHRFVTREKKRGNGMGGGGGVLPGIKKRVRAGRDNCCRAFAGTF